jgi:hypothetical protein
MTLHPDHTRSISPADKGSAGESRVGIVDWLCLAAAPTFAIMALFSAFDDGPDMICSHSPDGLPLSGMTVMYLLMSVFHLAPWLRVISARGSRSPVNG